MKVLLLNGSPKAKGNTALALAEMEAIFAQEGIETEIVWIENKPVGGCIACGTCRNTGKCVFDDVVNRIREKCETADAFVFGSPVHYAAMSGNMKGFMDRLFYSAGSTFYMKPAACVLSARRAGTTAAFDEMIKYFTISQMPVVSSRYWNMVHGAAPEQVAQDEEGLFTMRVLGKNMAYCSSAWKQERQQVWSCRRKKSLFGRIL